MSLFDRLLGREQLPAGVPRAWAEALDTVLEHAVQQAGGGRSTWSLLRDYVLDGPAGAAVPTLNAHPTLRQALRFSHYGVQSAVEAAGSVLVGLLPTVRPDVALRWLLLADDAVGTWYGGSGSAVAFPDGTTWPLLLAEHGERFGPNRVTRARPLPLSLFEALAVAAGWPPETVLVTVLRSRDPDYRGAMLARAVLDAPDLADALTRYAGVVAAAHGGPIGPEGVHLAQALVRSGPAAAAQFDRQAAALLTSSSKKTRAEARPLLDAPATAGPGPVRDALLDVARSGGTTAERATALSLLHEVAVAGGDAALLATARETAAADRSAVVRRLVEEWSAAAGLGSTDAAPATRRDTFGGDAALPAVEPVTVDWRLPGTPVLLAAVDDVWRWADAENTRWNGQVATGQLNPSWAKPGRPLGPELRRAFLEFLASPSARPGRAMTWSAGGSNAVSAAARLASGAGVVASVKLLSFFGVDRANTWAFNRSLDAAPEPVDLLTAQALMEPFGRTPKLVLEAYCSSWNSLGAGLPDTAVWPFFVLHADLVEDLVRTEPTYEVDRSRLFAGIATMPAMPQSLARLVLAVALGPGKRDRLAAQAALARVPGKQDRIVAALADGKGEIRAAAARWLGDLGDPAAVPALEAAWATEKQDVARAAILDALEALGRPVEAYLDLTALLRDAAKAATKPAPAALDWLPWSTLPAVRWSAGTEPAGKEVPADLVRHLAVQAVKAKSPEPNALLRRYCALWDVADRQVLGRRLLDAWLAHDIAPISREEAERRAQAEAASWHRWMTASPQHYVDHPWSGMTQAQIAAAMLPGLLQTPAGSAIDSKGLLAVVAVTAGGDVAPPIERYLKEWYGNRLAQGKALLGMLAHVDHPAATALLLSVGNRFRTKGLQEEAARQTEVVAERRGWTVDELADRTIPTAGLDEGGTLALDYGPRSFTAVLAPDLTLSVRAPDGAPVKALPAPRAADDADLAAAAKKALAAAKKELKATVGQQTTRLYEAMCTGREWTFDDWDRYLNRHPVVRHLVQRLVWAQVEPVDGTAGAGGASGTDDVRVVRLFRPLDDGTLTDADDEPVAVDPEAVVRLAHDAFVDAAAVAAWTTHLADYAVAPPFGQLGAGFWKVPADRARSTAVEDFHGHVVEAFALRGRTSKLGWTRDQAEDAGVFSSYRKRFPALRLDAVVGFTGNTLPEENRTVALLDLRFERVVEGGQQWSAPPVPLGEVPPVLASECRNDVRLMAADGTGYDPDWERTTAW